MAINLLDNLKKLLSSNSDSTKTVTPTLATTGTMTNILAALPNPDPILKKAGKNISVYKELLGDDEVWSAVQSFKSGVQSLEWQITGDDDEARQAEIIALFKSYKLDSVISEILNARLLGFQPIEITWQTSGGKWLPIKLTGKPAEWFEYNNASQLCLKPANNATGVKELMPVHELAFIVPRHEATFANPYGEAILSRVFWSVAFKKGGVKFWATFTEKYGMPWVTGKLPRGAQVAEQNELLSQLDQMVQDAVAVIPDDSSVEILKTGDSGGTDIHDRFINFFIGQINKVILSQTLTSNSGGGSGSYALGKVHGEIREDVVAVGKRLVEEVFNQLLTWIYQFNYGIPSPAVFELYEEKDVDKVLAERDEILTRTGVKFTKDYFIENYGLKESHFDLQELGQPNNSEFSHKENCSCGCNSKKKDIAQFADKSEAFADSIQNSLDSLGENQNLQPLVNATLKPILELFNSLPDSTNPDEFFQKLAETYPELSTASFEEILSRVIFVSEVLGRLTDEAERE